MQFVCQWVSEWVCHTKPVERSTDRNIPPIFNKFAIKVDSQEMWLPIVLGGNTKYFRPSYTSETIFWGRTSGLSQWRAFQHISWRPIKLSSQNLTRLSKKLNFTKISNLGTKGAWSGSRDLILEFLDPLHISGTFEGRKFKFEMQIGHCGVLMKKYKSRSNGVVIGSREWPTSRILGPPPYFDNGLN